MTSISQKMTTSISRGAAVFSAVPLGVALAVPLGEPEAVGVGLAVGVEPAGAAAAVGVAAAVGLATGAGSFGDGPRTRATKLYSSPDLIRRSFGSSKPTS